MSSAEWLRTISRRELGPDVVAQEAAAALATWGRSPAGLVVACRRLLAHHPEHTALWWLAARVLGAPEPEAAAREATARLDDDPAAKHLAAALPLLEPDEVVATVGWPRVVDRALASRSDVAAIAVRVAGADPVSALRHREAPQPVPVVDLVGAGARAVRLVLVAATALGPDRIELPAGASAAVAAAGDVPVWLVVATGRVLPGPLLGARGRAVAAVGQQADDVLDARAPARVVGPGAGSSVAEVAARPDCPVVPELLRPLS